MPKLYFLPLYEEVYKPYSSHNNDVAKYKKTAFKKITTPVFGEGTRLVIEKYQKVGDYQDYGDSRWFREPYFAKKYSYNIVSITIDGQTAGVKNMVSCFDIQSGSHHIKLEMRAYKYNPFDLSAKKVKRDQSTQDFVELDLYAENGDYYLVATHKVQDGAYVYNDPYNSSASCIKGTYFEYHSAEANVVSKATFLSHLDSNLDFKNVDINSLRESPIAQITKHDFLDSSAPLKVKEVPLSSNFSTKQTSTPKQPKLSNDEYFDMLADSVSTQNSVSNSTTKNAPNKPTPCKPITYITDTEPKYAELYSDGTLSWKKDKEVYVPRQVTYIDKHFLWRNEFVKKVVLPDGIESLENSEFAECPNLEEITLPKNLKYFKRSCLSSCPNLTNIYLDASNPYYVVIDGVLYKRLDDGNLQLLIYPPQKTDSTFISPSNCTIIDVGAFNSNSYLVSADLSSIAAIELSAMAGCKNLREITFGKSIKQIGTFAFENTDLTRVEVPFSCKIGRDTFPKSCKVKKKLSFK
ncbi:MAG: leucine-rich repeat domain-containing protein [Clostridia bacterium]|nr:leucine-rich repeat domain-containing protein [Clostridia bacterium]